MDSYNWLDTYQRINSDFPTKDARPIIGITGNYDKETCTLAEGYYQSVLKAGGIPFIIPPFFETDRLGELLDRLDGILFSGGGDINPLLLGEEPIKELHSITPERDQQELLLARLAYDRQIPILGICKGIQIINAALGGTLYQDIHTQMEGTRIKHSQDEDRRYPSHQVSLTKGSILAKLFGTELAVNSFHHQACKEAAPGLKVTAMSADGVIEAIESNEFKSIMGVQWHPETYILRGCTDMLPIFEWLVGESADFKRAKKLHAKILTLDSHCDTPMFFHQGIRFEQRDPRILVDLHKMSEGRQNAVIMAAYLPQPKMGEAFASKVAFDVKSPKEYADLIFDKIEDIVKDNYRYISIARTPAELYDDKRKGRKSIMLAIENGIALNHDIDNIQHFAQRGVVYMTLCHNGDNDICDSAKGSETHHGVSKFGQQVIEEMNRQGIMVDLSHAAESSFYDALEISKTPIVCSHSNCKALCDVPRNLSDDQMRKLARKGGVAHITLYGGFLRKQGEATILDALNHLEHAISIMGIEHVGLGTDFDGDGGVRGIADSSELINFTLHLLRRKYSERDIQKIWGGNWLRVMAQVQNMKE